MAKVRFFRQQKSTRELRRMGEREQKRQQHQQALAAWWALSPEERQKRIADHESIQRMQRNGITIEDVNNAAQEGYREGAKIAAEKTMKNIYAACALVLHEKYGFGKKRCMDMLNAIDEKVMYALDSQEMIEQVWDDLGIAMTFGDEALEERIKEKGA